VLSQVGYWRSCSSKYICIGQRDLIIEGPGPRRSVLQDSHLEIEAGADLAGFISDEMREDWESNRDELIKFWQSGKYNDGNLSGQQAVVARGSADTLPWAARHLESYR